MLPSVQIQKLEQLHRDWRDKHKHNGLRTTFPFARNLTDLYHWFTSLVSGRGGNIENYDFVSFVDPLLTIEENKQLLEGLITAPTGRDEEGLYAKWTEEANMKLENEAQINGLFDSRDKQIRKLQIRNGKLQKKYLEARYHQNIMIKSQTRREERGDPNDILEYFDLGLARKGNMLLIGTNQSGKSNLAKILMKYLELMGFWIVVFDPVSVLANTSHIKNVKLIEQYSGFDQKRGIRPNNLVMSWESIVYDLSILLPDRQKMFINDFCEGYWMLRRIGLPKKKRSEFTGKKGHLKYIKWRIKYQRDQAYYSAWMKKPAVIVLEEAQLYARYLSSGTGQQIMRIVTAGANPPFRTRLMAITPRISRVDTDVADGCQQRWLGITDGARDRLKIRDLFGPKYVPIAKELDQGQFVWKHGRHMNIVRTPEYKENMSFNDIPL